MRGRRLARRGRASGAGVRERASDGPVAAAGGSICVATLIAAAAIYAYGMLAPRAKNAHRVGKQSVFEIKTGIFDQSDPKVQLPFFFGNYGSCLPNLSF